MRSYHDSSTFTRTISNREARFLYYANVDPAEELAACTVYDNAWYRRSCQILIRWQRLYDSAISGLVAAILRETSREATAS